MKGRCGRWGSQWCRVKIRTVWGGGLEWKREEGGGGQL
jgi:hypothetical protein